MPIDDEKELLTGLGRASKELVGDEFREKVTRATFGFSVSDLG